MKKSIIIAALLAAPLVLVAQDNDTTLTRNVTVERAFQPVIKDAGKINRKPEVVEMTYTPVQVTYSDYIGVLSPDFNMTSLMSQPIRFEKGEPLLGHIRAGAGFRNTLFDFGYTKDDGKKNYLDLFAKHDAVWGPKTGEKTALGFTFRHRFSAAELYLNVEGSNQFYTRYGQDFLIEDSLRYRHLSQIDSLRRQNIWQGGFHVGVRSATKSDIHYDIRTGYNAYLLTGYATEHQIRTRFNVEWTSAEHHVGATLQLRDMFYSLADTTMLSPTQLASVNKTGRHALFVEPYYEYNGKRFMIHIGANIQTVFGKGTLLAADSSDISFAPSPNIRFEAQIAPRWLTIYGSATGKIASGSIQDAVNANPYYTLKPLLYSHHVGPYTPVDAELGFHIKAHRNLLLEIHAGYALHLNAKTPVTSLYTGSNFDTWGMLDYFYANEQTVKIGGAVSYHYKDYVNIHLWGDYFFNKEVAIGEMGGNDFSSKYFPNRDYEVEEVFGHPKWHLGCTIDSRIDRNWSLYTTLNVVGSRLALVDTTGKRGETEEDHGFEIRTLAPMANWNLGAKYDLLPNLSFYLELQNLICRYNQLYYGYASEGTQFQIGVDWKF